MPDPQAATQITGRALDSQNQSQITGADTLPKPEQTKAPTVEPGNLTSNDAAATTSQTSPAAGESNLVPSKAGGVAIATENASTVDTATSTTTTTTAGTSSASTTSTTTMKVKLSENF
jgi:hypothetical protein